MDMYGFYTGQAFDAHEYLGAHMTAEGVVFRTFAPNAARVSLLLDSREIPMNRGYDGNFHEFTVADAKAGDVYEYRIEDIQSLTENMYCIQFASIPDFLVRMLSAKFIPHTDRNRFPTIREQLEERR